MDLAHAFCAAFAWTTQIQSGSFLSIILDIVTQISLFWVNNFLSDFHGSYWICLISHLLFFCFFILVFPFAFPEGFHPTLLQREFIVPIGWLRRLIGLRSFGLTASRIADPWPLVLLDDRIILSGWMTESSSPVGWQSHLIQLDDRVI